MRRERGLAAVTAILIVAVAASAATFMLSQQSAMLDQTMMVAARAQADLYAQAGLDWARGVLAEDFRNAKEVDSLEEGWAQPIAALPVERAVVSGLIVDEQGKFNLNNLANNGQKSDNDVLVFKRLLANVGLPGELSDAVLDWIDFDSDLAGSGGAEDAYPLLPSIYRAASVPWRRWSSAGARLTRQLAKLKPYVPRCAPPRLRMASDVVLTAALHAREKGDDRRERRSRRSRPAPSSRRALRKA